jgi:hypothetical protein
MTQEKQSIEEDYFVAMLLVMTHLDKLGVTLGKRSV